MICSICISMHPVRVHDTVWESVAADTAQNSCTINPKATRQKSHGASRVAATRHTCLIPSPFCGPPIKITAFIVPISCQMVRQKDDGLQWTRVEPCNHIHLICQTIFIASVSGICLIWHVGGDTVACPHPLTTRASSPAAAVQDTHLFEPSSPELHNPFPLITEQRSVLPLHEVCWKSTLREIALLAKRRAPNRNLSSRPTALSWT